MAPLLMFSPLGIMMGFDGRAPNMTRVTPIIFISSVGDLATQIRPGAFIVHGQYVMVM